MRWFGFGFNAFRQITGRVDECSKGDDVSGVKVVNPTEIRCSVTGSGCTEISGIRASWSRRASLHLDGDHHVCSAHGAQPADTRGCQSAVITERHLILAFSDRVEAWEQDDKQKTPTWSMKLKPQQESSDSTIQLPLVAEGYIATTPPFYHCVAPQLKAKSLALGAKHAVLLSVTGAVHTWGLGSHGQLGHGSLTSEEEPKPVEALWGMSMSCVAAGGWHSVCISDGGDLYVWGWNESGQLGLPSQALRQSQKQSVQVASQAEPAIDGDNEEVFISIQAFPALLDLNPACDMTVASCGSRHTAAVTTKGDLYTWGWGEYGQLGYQTSCSDEPLRVEFFTERQMCVADVVCGSWNTFAAVKDVDPV
ncbi:RCC1 domain-containing protein 1-like [Synchiropus splendidus]|uniref:RCC1 domain-containing protein 1-like n=1 Tax=Synchiropus splendidus TaxID=270530 RepID=UPI00237DE756|nr:RCC1 domain-containing protein 1-like [Synchiropus splendidus]